MKLLCALLSVLTIAGCTHLAPNAQSPDAGYSNESKWQQENTKKQEACVMRIIEIAPPTATAEELDYNLKMCMLHYNLFILNQAPATNLISNL